MRRVAVAALIWLILSCGLATARDYRIRDFRADLVVDKDGSMHVMERIEFLFSGSFQGIYRTIPVEYPGPGGTNYSLLLDVLGVNDGSGNQYKYKISREGDFLKVKVWVPGAQDTSKTVVISYRVRNGLRYFETHDELYWNVTGNDWPVPIDNASAQVVLPESRPEVRAQAFTGVYGSKLSEAEWRVQDRTVLFETTNPLPSQGGLTIDVYLPKGLVREPGGFTRAWWFLRSNPLVALPVFAFVVMYFMWHLKGRDPDPGVSVAPMYEPPKDLRPAEIGAMTDDSVDMRDITSVLIDLAVRGYIRIEEVVEEGLLFDKTDYDLHLIKPEPWEDLNAYEELLLQQIFLGGTKTRISALAQRFYTTLPTLREMIMYRLKKMGVYRVDPRQATTLRFVAVLFIVVPFLLLHLAGLVQLFQSAGVAFASAVATVLIVWLIGRHMTAKTFRGMRLFVSVRGFEEFLTRVEGERLRLMPADTFEKFLPYAIALGVEKRWARKFEGIYQTPPQWYAGRSPMSSFHPGVFTDNLSRMADRTAHSMAEAPRSSSSGSGFSGGGGSSGGGFSGGGFGGGGGGAF